MSARRPMARPPEVPRPFTTPTPRSSPGRVHFDAPARQLVCHQRRSTGLLERQLGMRVQVLPDCLQLGVVFADVLDGVAHAPIRIRACPLSQAFSSLAAPSRAQRPSLAGHAGPIPHLAVGSDAAADAGGGGHSLLPALPVALSDVQALARADEDEVLRLWSGLGYYAARATCIGPLGSRLRARRQIPGFGGRDRAGSPRRSSAAGDPASIRPPNPGICRRARRRLSERPDAGCARGRSSRGRSRAAAPRPRPRERAPARRKARQEALVVGMTAATCVCCSITSDSQMRYGSRVPCQGRPLRP